MDDDKFPEIVLTVIEAAQSFVDTDAAYGPHDPRTQMKKERLAHAMGKLAPTNVDVPQLRIVGDAHEMPTLPVPDPQRWGQVRAHLTRECELPALSIDALHAEGKIYADLRGNAVFIGEDEHRIPTTAYIHGVVESSDTRGGSGWFMATLAGEDPRIPPVLIVAERPVDALSALEMHRRLYRDRPGGKDAAVTVMSTEGSGGLPHRAIQETLTQGGTVRVATANTPSGELIWRQLREQYPWPRVERARPMEQGWTWNDVLRFTKAPYRDPQAADRQLRELQQQNAPDAQAREAVRKMVQRLGPARDRDPYER